MSERATEYVEIARETGVLVNVPKRTNSFMNQMKEFTTDSGEVVPFHWQNGRPMMRGLILNVFFYDLKSDMFGHRIVATVKVMKMTLSDGRDFTFINVFATPGVIPTCELKVPESNDKKDQLHILHSNQRVEFRGLKSRKQAHPYPVDNVPSGHNFGTQVFK